MNKKELEQLIKKTNEEEISLNEVMKVLCEFFLSQSNHMKEIKKKLHDIEIKVDDVQISTDIILSHLEDMEDQQEVFKLQIIEDEENKINNFEEKETNNNESN